MTQLPTPSSHSRARKNAPINFTDATASTKAPGEYQDAKQPALRLYVSPKGARTWTLYKWSGARNQAVRKKIGNVTSMNVKVARQEAARLALELEKGADLRRSNKVVEGTLESVVKAYTVEAKQKGARQWYWAERHINRSFSDWLKLPLSKITFAKLDERYREIAFGTGEKPKRGKGAASMSIQALRTVYAYAIKKDMYEGKNVAQLIEVEAAKPRQRVMVGDEQARIMEALRSPQFRPHVYPFFRLLMLTGVRWSNLAAARWENIDLKNRTWIIPAEKSKAGHVMELHLREEAVELFEGQKGQSDEWVFPSPNGAMRDGKRTHLIDPMLSWKAVLKLAGITERLTPHDLRRSFGSILLEQGVPMPAVSKMLGHSNVATTEKHYGVYSPKYLREQLDRVRG
ncbi:tyrosine-type recombinase/integrase [Variovorax sp. YR566]|uniref:tyrosine-type recombinase/integrase n=1 Tax=Variovorax sp. YR566 TaxID=3450237 RepID=UPI003F7F5001